MCADWSAATPGVPCVARLEAGRRRQPGLEAPWQAEQSSPAGRGARPGAGDRAGTVCGLWPDIGGGEVGGTPWLHGLARDPTRLDDRRRAVQDRRHRLPSPHQPRRRRECLGELVQIDGSEHAWFEDRAPVCTVLAFIDDATSRLMQVRFVASESAFDYFRTTRAYLEQHGKPVALYSDKHGIFRVNNKDAIGGDGITQFGRALAALNIDIICANSPQAKGRIERAFGTLQDRLVKELRLAGISTLAAANAWLPEFVETYNKRFGRSPANAKNLHRPLTEADDLDEILAWREARTVTRNLTLRYDRMMLLLDPTPFARGLAGKKVEVVNYPDGRFAVRHDAVALPFRVFDKIQTVMPGAIVENKRLGAALAFARQRQASYPPNRKRGDPRRRRPPNNLEAPGMPTKGRPSRKVLDAAE